MIEQNDIKLPSFADIFIMLISGGKDKSLCSILASYLSLFIFATTLTQYLVFLTFMAEPRWRGLVWVQGWAWELGLGTCRPLWS